MTSGSVFIAAGPDPVVARREKLSDRSDEPVFVLIASNLPAEPTTVNTQNPCKTQKSLQNASAV